MSAYSFWSKRLGELILSGLAVLILMAPIQSCIGVREASSTGGSIGNGGSSGGPSSSTFLYVTGLSQVGPANLAGFQINSGAVAAIADSPFQAPGFTPSMAAYGDLLFTLSGPAFSNQTLVTWRIDRASGNLKQIATNSSSLLDGGSLAIGGPGKFLYVVLQAKFALFAWLYIRLILRQEALLKYPALHFLSLDLKAVLFPLTGNGFAASPLVVRVLA